MNEKEKNIFNITIIPRLPSLTSTLDSIKEYPNVQNIAQKNNILKKLDPKDFLSSDQWIVEETLVSIKMIDFINKEFNKK